MNVKLFGLFIILFGFLFKAILHQVYPNGFLIDLCRLSFFAGVAMILIGVFKKNKT